jgi:hypothetical protein
MSYRHHFGCQVPPQIVSHSPEVLAAALADAARDRPQVMWSAYPASSLWSDYRPTRVAASIEGPDVIDGHFK